MEVTNFTDFFRSPGNDLPDAQLSWIHFFLVLEVVCDVNSIRRGEMHNICLQ